ncbi:MAG TPA: hypothetical protein GXX46_11315 [Peptococcaceae bacterium]|jgi:hypothetical protein|nr:hypothetical protein [Peptococcaceae bacterium]
MPEKLIRELMLFYRDDLRDLEELRVKMNEFRDFLNQPMDRTEKLANCDPEHDQSPKGDLPLKINDDWAQEFTKYTAWRSECYQKLQERAKLELELQTKVCNLIGKLPFQAVTLQPYLEEGLYQEFIGLSKALRAKMAEVLALDDVILPKLQMELEGIKLELHRLQNAQRTKNAYENLGPREARFIDKTK